MSGVRYTEPDEDVALRGHFVTAGLDSMAASSPHTFTQRETSVMCAGIASNGERCTKSSKHVFCKRHNVQAALLTPELQGLVEANWVSLPPEGATEIADQAHQVARAELEVRRPAPKRFPSALTDMRFFPLAEA